MKRTTKTVKKQKCSLGIGQLNTPVVDKAVTVLKLRKLKLRLQLLYATAQQQLLIIYVRVSKLFCPMATQANKNTSRPGRFT